MVVLFIKLAFTLMTMFMRLTLLTKFYAGSSIVNNAVFSRLLYEVLDYYFNWGCVDKCRKGCCQWEKEDPEALPAALRSTWWYDSRDI